MSSLISASLYDCVHFSLHLIASCLGTIKKMLSVSTGKIIVQIIQRKKNLIMLNLRVI